MRSSCILDIFSLVPMDHSLLSAVGAWPPHNGVMENKASQSVSRPSGDAEVRDSKRDRLALRPHGNDTPRFVRRDSVCASLCCLACWRLAPAELALIAPHAVHDDSKLASDGNAGLRHAAPLRDVHAPCLERRPFLAPGQQRMGGLIQQGAGKLVAASADAALDIGFARLISSRGEAEMGAHIA